MSNANGSPLPMTPLFGSGSMSRRQRMADALAMDATEYEPNGAWTNLLGKAARGYAAGRMQDQLDRERDIGAPIDIRPRGGGISGLLSGFRQNLFGG